MEACVEIIVREINLQGLLTDIILNDISNLFDLGVIFYFCNLHHYSICSLHSFVWYGDLSSSQAWNVYKQGTPLIHFLSKRTNLRRRRDHMSLSELLI